MVQIKGGKIILHSKDSEYSYALDINTVNFSKNKNQSVTWAWFFEGDEIKVKESFDEILEAIKLFRLEEKLEKCLGYNDLDKRRNNILSKRLEDEAQP